MKNKLGMEIVDYYSDDEYNYASYLEEQQPYETTIKEEEIEEYHRNEYYKSLDKESTNVQ
jgi:hypothetical protein